jgi:hypothetical protein
MSGEEIKFFTGTHQTLCSQPEHRGNSIILPTFFIKFISASGSEFSIEQYYVQHGSGIVYRL